MNIPIGFLSVYVLRFAPDFKALVSQTLVSQVLVSGGAFNSGNTEITVAEDISKEGYGAIMETGTVAETDVPGGPDPPDGDRAILYAAPKYYFRKTGIQDTSFFNYKGATHQGKSFLSTLRERIPSSRILWKTRCA